MRDSNQKGRVNISLDVLNQGAVEKKELPCRVLVIGEFSKNNSCLSDLKKCLPQVINLSNFDLVMKKMSPAVSFSVKNHLEQKDQLNVDLVFESMKGFTPDSLIQQIPILKKYYTMRLLLKDLRMQLYDYPSLKDALTDVVKKNKLADVRRAVIDKIRYSSVDESEANQSAHLSQSNHQEASCL